MRKLSGFLAQLGMLVSLPLGIISLFVAWQLQKVSGTGRPEPQSLSVAELIERGAGDNVHVELTQFRLDKPIMEEHGGHLRAFWVAVFPAGKKKPGEVPAVVFRTALAPDQDQLNAILEQKSLTVMVASALPDCRLKVFPAAALYEAYPKLDPLKVIVLSDPGLVIEGRPILTGNQLFDRSTPRIAWGAASGTLVLGSIFMLLWRRLGSRPRRRHAQPLGKLTDNFRLTERSPVSTHEFKVNRTRGRVFAWFGGSALLLAAGLGLLAFSALAYRDLKLNLAMMSLLAGGFFLACGIIGFAFSIGEFAFPISGVVLFHGGIRWQQRRRCYTALWSDIESVYRQGNEATETVRKKGTACALKLVLHSGKVLQFTSESLSDYNRFADAVQQSHGRYTLEAKQREMADYGEAWFGDIGIRPAGLVVDDRLVTWADLERFEVAFGQLRLHLPRAWHKVRSYALKDIPNYDALLSMLRPSGSRDGLRNALSLLPSR